MKLGEQWSRERFALEAGAAVVVALGLDVLCEPPAAWHPVVWFGKLIQRLEQAAPQGHVPQLLYGVVMLVRDCTSFGLPQFVRVATRPMGDWQQLLLALQEIV